MIVCTNEQQDGRVNWQNAGLLVTTNKLLPARRFASALLTALPVSVSVCLSVCLSHVSVLSKYPDVSI